MVEKNLRVLIREKSASKKHSRKQVISITCTLQKRLLAAATFKGLWLVSFQTE